MSTYPALGFDPSPGDPKAIHGFVAQLAQGINSTEDALNVISGDENADWSGKAADAFRQTLNSDFQPHLRDINGAFRASQTALGTWAEQLSSYQNRANQLESQAQQAKQTLAARVNEDNCLRQQAAADPFAADASMLRDSRCKLSQAHNDLQDILARARALEVETATSASACARALSGAAGSIKKYSGTGWEKLVDGAAQLGVWIGEKYEWFMDNVIPIIEDIVDFIVPIVGIAALFVPALGPLALGLAATSVAIDGLQALRGEEGAAREFFFGVAGLGAGALLGSIAKALGGGTNQLFIPTLSGGGGSLAYAGGGTAAAAGSLTLALKYSPEALAANTFWMSTKVAEAHTAGTDLVTGLTGPGVNVFERLLNLAQGEGPRTDEELSERR